jgi:hypothetical protein
MRYLPTVTEVIGPWVDFSKIPPDTLQAASERGTEVHDACAMIAHGIPWFPITNQTRAIAGYVESYKKWFERIVASTVLLEKRMFSEAHGYCGQLDLVVDIGGGENWLVDLKTPVIKSKSWRVQIAAYQMLCVSNEIKVDRCGSLRLDKNGKLPRMDWYEGSAEKDFNIFLSCLNAFRFFKG